MSTAAVPLAVAEHAIDDACRTVDGILQFSVMLDLQ